MKKCVKCGKINDPKNLELCQDEAQKLRSGYYFFNFPKNAKLRKEMAIKLDLPKSLKITAKDVVCSAHVSGDFAKNFSEENIDSEEEMVIERLSPEPGEEEEEYLEVTAQDPPNQIEKECEPTIMNGVALFACAACPALFAQKSALDDHIALRGSSWNSKSHVKHYKDLLKAWKKVARDPTAYNLTVDNGVPSVKRRRMAHHYYSNAKNSRRRRTGSPGIEDETVNLPSKIFPDLVMKPNKVDSKKLLANVRCTLRGAQRRKDLDCILLRLMDEAGQKQAGSGFNVLPKKNGFLRVLKDGRVMRERSFIT